MTDFVQNETMSTNESQNKVLFVQYGDCEPVKVETHFNRELERSRELFGVADVNRFAVMSRDLGISRLLLAGDLHLLVPIFI